MKASIIVPTLNESRSIEACLTRLHALRDDLVEIIVVDGGSDDTTIELARSLADIVISAERGRALQMNAGAEVASGDYLFFLHADTLIPGGFVGRLNEIEQCNVRWGFFKLKLMDGHPVFRLIESMINWRSSFFSIGTGDQLIYCQRDCFAAIGGFQEIPIMEDVALSKSLKANFGSAHIVPETVQTSARRWRQYGIVRTVLLMWRLRWEYFLGVNPKKLAQRYR